MMLQKESKENGDKLKIYVMCPGLTEDQLVMSFDKKSGVFDITSKIDDDCEMCSLLDLEVGGTIEIPPKFRGNSVEANVKNGILTLTFGLAENVNLIKCK